MTEKHRTLLSEYRGYRRLMLTAAVGILMACNHPAAPIHTADSGADVVEGVEARGAETDHGMDGCLSRSDCPSLPQCRQAECEPLSGLCIEVPRADGFECDDGLLCTENDECVSGKCLGKPVACPGGQQCHDSVCDEKTGECVETPASGSCDDANLCTTDDYCVNGICTGVPADCSDANPCTTDACDLLEGCRHLHFDFAPCQDEDPCTADDQCISGTCVGQPVVCDDGNPCTQDSCDPNTGECQGQPWVGAGCDDGNHCTLDDTCEQGVCTGGQSLVCDDGEPCTDDHCSPEAGCQYPPNSAPCDDGNPCTIADTCTGGQCAAGTAKGCQDGNPCTQDFCELTTGECIHAFVNWPCDDGDLCTTNDQCDAGLCSGQPVNCDDDNPCTADGCTSGAGCFHTPVAAGCEDGNPCTVGDMCSGGACQPGPTSIDCNDFNSCTHDSCIPASGDCLHQPVDGACDDGNPCTTDDTCLAGVCTPGALDQCECFDDADCLPFDDGNKCNGVLYCDVSGWPQACKLYPGSVVKCSEVFDSQCQKSVCTPATGQCILTNLADGKPCNDQDHCTIEDSCTGGACLGIDPQSCDDGNPCTDDECQSASGCHYQANSVPCDDLNPCSLGDFCQGGNCIGVIKTCDDGNPCTTGICDPEDGLCVFIETPGSCDDTNPCTQQDHCEDGVCIGDPRDCADDYVCTEDTCEPATGCVHTPLVGECDDQSTCTVDDKCAGIFCSGTAIACNDGNQCTDDLCISELGGCVFKPNLAPCSDGNACTYGDLCAAGECNGLPVTCDDGNPCTSASCHPLAGCVITHLDIPCDDVNPCTVSDWCVAGVCIPGTPVVCDDGNECTLDYCGPETGDCVSNPIGKPCDDGDPCTTYDLCKAGNCTGFMLDCNDLNQCTTDYCDGQVGCVHDPIEGAFCADSLVCTTGDICQAGECVGTGAPDCDDGNECTNDLCADPIGCVHQPLTGDPCDDNDQKTLADVCLDGSCIGLADTDEDGIATEGYDETCAAGIVLDCVDNCPQIHNPLQQDGDFDAVGDACEMCGDMDPIDGNTPPYPGNWAVTATGDCPQQNVKLKAAKTQAGEFALEAVAYRDLACQAGWVSLFVGENTDLFGLATVIEVDLEWSAWAYPLEFAAGELAGISVTDGENSVQLYHAPTAAGNQVCGESLDVPEEFRRGLWRLEFDPFEEVVTVFLDGLELDDSPFDLAALGPSWALLFEATAADLLGDCGTAALLRFYQYRHLCDW